MRKNIAFLLLCLMMAITASARPVSREEARQRALSFMQLRGDKLQLQAVTNARRLAPRRMPALSQATDPYYVFDRGNDQGFVIVSGDDETIDVLGYCDNGTFDYEQMPPSMREWLDDYARQIEQIQAGAPILKDAVAPHPKVEQLMTCTWSQGYPYNMTCPMYFNLGQSVTGCVATAMAQILYYHRDKNVSETQAEMPGYTTWTEHPTYGRLAVEGIPANSPIDWENMKDSYGSANDKQRLAVADLMHYCGVAVHMDYTNSSSGAQVSECVNAFVNYFGYGSSVRLINDYNVSSDTEWDQIVYNELANGRPVYLSGHNASAGHAFVTDGYDGNLRYHINWGWGGQSDGYYYLTNLTPGQGQGIGGSSDGYNSYREFIVGIEPENYAEKTMKFSDSQVGTLCKQFDADGDGKLTYGEAAQVTDLGTVFKGSTAIKSFSELYYFTSLTSLSDDAFSGCTQLTTVRLPRAMKSLGDRAFKGCTKLSKVIFPDNLTSIGEEAFSGCKVLSNLEIPEELSAIKARTFKDCAAISSVELPTLVSTIGDEAFAGCTGLTAFTVKTFHPENIVLGENVFGNGSQTGATLHVLQSTKEYFTSTDQWKDFGTIHEERERSEGKFADFEVGKKYYLYNVATGLYLTKGEAWGTQAIVGSDPMRFVVRRTASMPEDTYYLTSEDTGKSGTYLFRTNTDNNIGVGVMAAFVDGGSLTTNAYWSIRSLGNNVYTIQIPTTDNNYQEGLFWGVQSDHQSNVASPTHGVYGDVAYADHQLGCQWQFVLYDEEQSAKYEAAMALSNLLNMAKKRKISTENEQAVFDNMGSTRQELRDAQRSLRQQMGFVDFADDAVAAVCINRFDLDTDGELSIAEATKADEFYEGTFMNKGITSFDELQYFTSLTTIYANTFSGCTQLKSVTLPENLERIYYYAFRNCSQLTSIRLPEYVRTIGNSAFLGCKALTEVIAANPEPVAITASVFSGVDLSACTLRVPFGAKARYEAANVWKEFGTIVEMRGRTQPKYSPLTTDKDGYLMNLATHQYLNVGEAYGTQSIVSTRGLRYQLKRNNAMADSTFYLYSEQVGKTNKVLYRVSDDEKVGDGVKACFADGIASAKAYWRFRSVGENVYVLHVPSTDATYVDNEYLGVDDSHYSGVASPTKGVYWDIEGTGAQSQWVFVTIEDMNEAQLIDKKAADLKKLLQLAAVQTIDAADEQAVYDNPQSGTSDFDRAVRNLRKKLSLIDFADEKARNTCVDKWDQNGDGELSYAEAAQVTDLDEAFQSNKGITQFEEFQYFTGLTALPTKAFNGATSLKIIHLPSSISQMGDYAFSGCDNLLYMVIPNETVVIPKGWSGISEKVTLFVPAHLVADYQAEKGWKEKNNDITAYTGKPVVTAVGNREYGRNTKTSRMKVEGAPIMGEAELSCDVETDMRLPAGQYPISVSIGTITTPDVELREGVLTVSPAPVTITAKSYTRNAGEPNPEFEVTFSRFRNRETDTVLTVRPIITCEATVDSPAGDYEIKVSGAEAANYVFTYVSGKLTVVGSSGIDGVAADKQPKRVFDLQGRPVKSAGRRGLFVIDRKKQLMK